MLTTCPGLHSTAGRPGVRDSREARIRTTGLPAVECNHGQVVNTHTELVKQYRDLHAQLADARENVSKQVTVLHRSLRQHVRLDH